MTWRALLAVLLLGLLSVSVPSGAADGPQALRTERLEILTSTGPVEFTAEIADTPEATRKGLMFRRELAANRVMLFDFSEPRPVAMWMKNTFISLDMFFVREDGTIARIEERTTPHSLAIIESGEPVLAVIEAVAGTASRLDIRPGDRVRHRLFPPPSE